MEKLIVTGQDEYKNASIDRLLIAFSLEWTASGLRKLEKGPNSGLVSYGTYLLFYLLEGSGSIQGDSQEFSAKAGDAFLIPLGTVFEFRTEEDCRVLYFQFSLRMNSGQSGLFFRNMRRMHVGMKALEMEEWYRSENNENVLKLGISLYQDILTMSDDRTADTDNRLASYSLLTRRALAAIHDTPSIRMTVARVAEELNVSPSTLRKRFQADTGMPLGAYLDTQVYRHAAGLLMNSDLQVGEIADRLGFCDQFYFCRFFKRFEGMTPSKFRQRSRQ